MDGVTQESAREEIKAKPSIRCQGKFVDRYWYLARDGKTLWYASANSFNTAAQVLKEHLRSCR